MISFLLLAAPGCSEPFEAKGGSGGAEPDAGASGGSPARGGTPGTGGSGGTAGSGTAGAGTAGSGTAGTGTAGGVGMAGAAGSSMGGMGGVAGLGGSGGSGGEEFELTVDNFCPVTAGLFCEFAEPCCTALHGYNQAACEAAYLAECEVDAAAVRMGTKSFDPDFFDECYTGLAELLLICRPSALDFLERFDSLRACNLLISGDVTEGQFCSVDSDCKQSSDPDTTFTCGGLLQIFGFGTCQRSMALPLGATCFVGDGVDGESYCREGLYCDISADLPVGQPPFQGTCIPAVPEGFPCVRVGPFDLECGLGFYCEETSGVCVPSQPGGASCLEATECESLSCFQGQCGAAAAIVTRAECR